MTWDELVAAIRRYVREREVRAVGSQTPPTGKDLLEAWGLEGRHGSREVCPECGKDCSMVGLQKLMYSFEVCNCGEVPFLHLVEQLHHRSCLQGAKP